MLHSIAVTVSYIVTYPVDRCRDVSDTTPPIPSVNVTIPRGGTALQVMEAAVDINRSYRFAATYFGSTLGYFINAVNSIPPIIEPSESCFWLFLIRTPDGEILPSNVGVSSYTFNDDGYGMILRYSAQTETIGNGTTIATPGMRSGALPSTTAITMYVAPLVFAIIYSILL